MNINITIILLVEKRKEKEICMRARKGKNTTCGIYGVQSTNK